MAEVVAFYSTDNEPQIEKRMRVLWWTGRLPTEEAVRDLRDDQWDYLHHFFQRFESEKLQFQMDHLERILGTHITSEDIMNLDSGPKYLGDKDHPEAVEKPDKMRVPLLWGMAPKILDHARKTLQHGRSLPEERFFTRDLAKARDVVLRSKKAEVEGFELSKDEFLQTVAHIQSVAAQRSHQFNVQRQELMKAHSEKIAKKRTVISAPDPSKLPPKRIRHR